MVVPSPSPRFRSRGSFGGAALLAAALLGGGCAGGATEDSVAARQAIAGGTVDTSHHSVFLLISHLQDTGGLCTATLIAPNLLLTARHCVSPNDEESFVKCGDSKLGEPFAPSAFLATNDPRPGRDSLFFRAVDVRVPGEGEDTCGFDIALITLSENVPSAVSTPAVPRIDRDVEPGEKYTAVGYGVDENGNSNGSRMQLSGLSIACEPGSCGEGVESTEFRGETGICSGDSGGPALDADGKVLGVVSRGGPDCSTPVYGSVSAWQDFLIETAMEAARVGDYEPPFWVTTRSSEPPAPPPSGEAGAGAGGSSSETPPGTEGDVCRSGGECAAGFVCFGNGTGVCTATCAATAECSAGQVCENVGDYSICLEPSRSADDSSGCSFGSGGPKSAGLAAALLGLLGALRRRARRG